MVLRTQFPECNSDGTMKMTTWKNDKENQLDEDDEKHYDEDHTRRSVKPNFANIRRPASILPFQAPGLHHEGVRRRRTRIRDIDLLDACRLATRFVSF